MSGIDYSIVFSGGIKPGVEISAAKDNIKKHFNLDDAKLQALFSGKRVVLKKALRENQATNYVKSFEDLGIIVSIEPPIIDQSTR